MSSLTVCIAFVCVRVLCVCVCARFVCVLCVRCVSSSVIVKHETSLASLRAELQHAQGEKRQLQLELGQIKAELELTTASEKMLENELGDLTTHKQR